MEARIAWMPQIGGNRLKHNYRPVEIKFGAPIHPNWQREFTPSNFLQWFESSES
jgi:hypothetical protein